MKTEAHICSKCGLEVVQLSVTVYKFSHIVVENIQYLCPSVDTVHDRLEMRCCVLLVY